MSQIAPLLGKLGQYSGHVGQSLKFLIKLTYIIGLCFRQLDARLESFKTVGSPQQVVGERAFLHNIMDTCALLHGTFFGMCLNILTSFTVDRKGSFCFFFLLPVYSFLENLLDEEFELYANSGNIIRRHLLDYLTLGNGICRRFLGPQFSGR